MYICQILAKFGDHQKEVIIQELLQILLEIDEYDCDIIPVTLVDLIVNNKNQKIVELNFNELDAVEQLALKEIAKSHCWNDITFPLEMEYKGLPNTREKLIKYINNGSIRQQTPNSKKLR